VTLWSREHPGFYKEFSHRAHSYKLLGAREKLVQSQWETERGGKAGYRR